MKAMEVLFGVAVLLAWLGGVCVSALGGEVLPLVADGSVSVEYAEPRWHVIDDYGCVRLNRDKLDDSHGYESRGIMEFSTAAAGPYVQSATLTIWQLDKHLYFEPWVAIYAYQGDGQITRGDFDCEATYITSVDFPDGYNFGVGVPFDTDILPAVEMAFAKGWACLGLRLQFDAYTGNRDVHYAAAVPPDAPPEHRFGGQPPHLSYEIPEPATLSLVALGGLALIRRKGRC